MRRRECVKSLLAVPAAVVASSTFGLRDAAAALQELPSDGESYWNHLRWQFLIPEGQAYFNTATLGASPRVVVDAVKLDGLGIPVIAEPRADGRYLCVAAASIVAKVARDAMMVEAARRFTGYGWERNKGYATAEHLEALRRLGPSPLHRRSFAPVRVLA